MRTLAIAKRVSLPLFILFFTMLFMLLSTNVADWVKTQGTPLTEVFVAH